MVEEVVVRRGLIPPSLRLESLAVGIIGLLLFTLGLWDQPFVAFETRFALFAKEMLRNGPTLFPTTYGRPYPDYPATSTLLIWLLSLPFGSVTKLSAVLPTAMASALNLAIVYRLLARYSRGWAVIAVCFELLTAAFLKAARSISLDQMVATATLLGFYLAYTADRDQRPALRRWLAPVLLCGFAVRGPMGGLIPAAAVASYYLLSTQWRALLRFAAMSLPLLVVAWACLLGLGAWTYGHSFVEDVVRAQVTGRVHLSAGESPSFYLTSSFASYALAYPVAVAVAVVAVWRVRRAAPHSAEFLVFLMLGWAALLLLGLSIPGAKKARYLLPIVPAIAALAAYPFVAEQRAILTGLKTFLDRLFLLLPAIAIAAVAAARPLLAGRGLAVDVPYGPVLVVLAGCQVIALALHLKLPDCRLRSAALAACAAGACWLVDVLLVEPATVQIHDSSGFVRSVEQLRRERPAALAFYRARLDADVIDYAVNLDYDLEPLIVRDPDELRQTRKPAYLLVAERELDSLRDLTGLEPAFDGRMNNNHYFLFYLAPSKD